MAPYQNQMVRSTALRRAAAIVFPRVLSGVFGRGFVTPDLARLCVRACWVAGCARMTWAGFADRKRGEANPARRSETSARDVETGEAMTPAPIRRRGRRLISTGQLDPSISRGRRLNGARLGGREPLALALAFRLGPPSAHVLSRSPHDVEKPILTLPVIRPPSSKKHARTNFQRQGS